MYRIQLQEFEGPLDLLLFFIQRDEIDIFDIPIAKIVDEYLEYVRMMGSVDFDGIADFIYMAALLIGIKVRMLLPRSEAEEGEEIIDPRQDLVDRILEYMRYKEAAERLETCQKERENLFTRGMASAPEAATVQDIFVNTSVYHLTAALGRILTEKPSVGDLAVERVTYTMEKQRAFITEVLSRGKKVKFGELTRQESRPFIITTFLAVLEMAHKGQIWLTSVNEADDFFVQKMPRVLQTDSSRLN